MLNIHHIQSYYRLFMIDFKCQMSYCVGFRLQHPHQGIFNLQGIKGPVHRHPHVVTHRLVYLAGESSTVGQLFTAQQETFHQLEVLRR